MGWKTFKKSVISLRRFSGGELSSGLCGAVEKSLISKLGIVVEEADESCFWLEFIVEEKRFTKKKCALLMQEAKELTAIFIASQKTGRKKSKIEN